MTLREEQQLMLRLLKNKSSPEGESNSTFLNKLKFQKDIIVWWRCFQFEHWLILTSKILKDNKLFEPLVLSFYEQNNISSYPAEAGEQFAKYIHNQPIHPIIKSVVALELALIKLKDLGRTDEYRIQWNQPPFHFLDALLNGHEYRLDAEGSIQYEMIVSNQVVGKMVVHALN